MDAMIGHALSAVQETRAAVRAHLAQMEPAIRRARSTAARSSQTVRDPLAETEARANQGSGVIAFRPFDHVISPWR
jgi:hypothetical protein